MPGLYIENSYGFWYNLFIQIHFSVLWSILDLFFYTRTSNPSNQDVDSKRTKTLKVLTTTEQDHPMFCLLRHHAIVRLWKPCFQVPFERLTKRKRVRKSYSHTVRWDYCKWNCKPIQQDLQSPKEHDSGIRICTFCMNDRLKGIESTC